MRWDSSSSEELPPSAFVCLKNSINSEGPLCWVLILWINFLPISLSHSGIAIMQMLICWLIYHGFLKLSSPYYAVFSFDLLTGWIQLPCLWVCSSFLPLHVVCYWISLLNFSVQLLYYSTVWLMFDSFLYFLRLCWNSHLVHALFSWSWWAHLWPLFWTLY